MRRADMVKIWRRKSERKAKSAEGLDELNRADNGSHARNACVTGPICG